MPTRSVSLLDAWRRNRRWRPREGADPKLGTRRLELLRDPGVVESISRQNPQLAELLPPAGSDVFRRFTPGSPAEDSEAQVRRRKEGPPKPNRDLDAEEALPFFYGKPPSDLINVPLEDLDMFYKAQKTFVVVNKGNVIFRFNAEPAFCILSPLSCLRRGAIKLLMQSWFRIVMIITVLSNCFMMTLQNPPNWYLYVQFAYIGIYTFEAIIKMLTRGFCVGKFTFLRDPWNWLDIFVIVLLCLSLFVHLKVLQVFPALKILALFPGVKASVGALFTVGKKLASVIILAIFYMSVLAVIALQLYMGNLKNKCELWSLDSNTSHSVHDFIPVYIPPGESEPLLCGNLSDSGVCPWGYICMKSLTNPNYGFTNFDQLGWAFLSIFRLIMLDFWENLFELTLRSSGKTQIIFFALVLIFGSFYMVSLIYALVVRAYVEQNEATIAEAKRKEKQYTTIVEQLKTLKAKSTVSKSKLIDGSEEENATNKVNIESSNVEDVDEPKASSCWQKFAEIFLKWNCCTPWVSFKKRLHTFMMNPFTDLFFNFCIVLNALIMALDHHLATHEVGMVMERASQIFTLIFTAEIILRIIAMDPYYFFKVNWNTFDCIVVSLALLEMFMGTTVNLYLFLMLRLFRLSTCWTTFRTYLAIGGGAATRNLAFLLAFTMLFFSVMGMHLFGDGYRERACHLDTACQLPRWHMADYFHSFMLVFRALCGEWIETMWDCMVVSGPAMTILFYTVILLTGKLVLVYFFISLLMDTFSATCQDKIKKSVKILKFANCRITQGTQQEDLKPKGDSTEGDEKKEQSPSADDAPNSGRINAAPAMDEEGVGSPEPCFSEKCIRCCPFLNADISQGWGKAWWTFRLKCYAIAEHWVFGVVMIITITLDSSALAFEDIYSNQRLAFTFVLECAVYVFTLVFIFEMLLKWAAYGFKVYFSSIWCWLDFLILNVTLVSMIADSLGASELAVFKFFHTMRALRPLRILSRCDGMRVVVATVARAIPCMLNVLMVCLLIWLIFAIMGVNMFAGKFHHCLNTTSGLLMNASQVDNQEDCLELMNNHSDVLWVSQNVNFDNVPMAFLSLLQVATFKGWMSIMYAAVDSRWIGDQPVYEDNLYQYLYFVIFIIYGAFLVLNLFIGVLIDHFFHQKEKLGDKDLFVTENQKRYFYSEWKVGPKKLIPRPSNKCTGLCYNLVSRPCFEIFIVTVICTDVMIMMLETDSLPLMMYEILFFTRLVITLIYVLECVLKIIGLRKYYFLDGLNIFDFIVVVISVTDFILADIIMKYFFSPNILRIGRLLRIVCILLPTKSAEGFRALLSSMKKSFPAVFNICLVLCLVMYIYTILGMSSFAYLQKNFMNNDIFNFETFGGGIISMFTITTWAGWDGFLIPMISSYPPDCDPDVGHTGSNIKGNCGSPAVGIAFLCSYIVISFVLVVFMNIAFMLEYFSVAVEESAEELCEENFNSFYENWKRFDPDMSQFISYNMLSDFCDTLKEPMRIPKPNAVKLVDMNIPMATGNKIHFVDILLALTADAHDEREETDTLKAIMEEKFMDKIHSKVSYEPITSTLKCKQEDVAARVIQKAWSKYEKQSKQSKDNGKQNPQNVKIKPNKSGKQAGDNATVDMTLFEDRHAVAEKEEPPAEVENVPLEPAPFSATDSNQEVSSESAV
ncbi:sodium channel protein type 4 subunit alpha-like [Denticeps clupeoides]|uniref:Sodium channel protein n=1 Tax=Denticeps clupeoides TaxID=299321 RepID=A0AAY4E158_9TELE|nr:sodium channel protein type 4 subunit alpha-like [Denticeps clupeoides]